MQAKQSIRLVFWTKIKYLVKLTLSREKLPVDTVKAETIPENTYWEC